MSWSEQRKYDAAVRAPVGRELHRPDSRILERSGMKLLLTPSATGYLNEVFFTDVGPGEVEAAIDEAIAIFRAHRLATKWYVGPTSRPADLGERLLRRGFDSWGVRAMGFDTERELAAPAGVEVVEVVGEDALDGFVDTSSRGWSMPADQRAVERQTLLLEIQKRPQTGHFFVARIDGEDVGTAGVFVRDGFGYLVGGQILESARGKGAYRALTAARVAFLRARGDAFAVSLARESTAAPMLEHLGFETVFACQCYLLPYSE